MAKVDNKRKGAVSIEGFNVDPGIQSLPSSLLSHWYLLALVAAEEMTVVDTTEDGEEAVSDDVDPYALFAKDEDGNPVQAVDENGDAVFDEETGEPAYVPAE